MSDFPRVIFTGKPSGSIIKISPREFIKFIKDKDLNSTPVTIFSAFEPIRKNRDFFLYALQDGFILSASTQEMEPIELFLNINRKGFSDVFEYLEFLYFDGDYNLDIKDTNYKSRVDAFRKFKESQFFGDKIFNIIEFIEASTKGFAERNQYIHAKRLGIPNKREYDKFLDSGYKKYIDFQEALKGNFTDRKDFYDAQSLGIDTFEKYTEFLNLGFKEQLNKIEAIENDANSAYSSKRYAEFLRLIYLSAEKIGELVYSRLVGDLPSQENNINLSQIILSIQNKIGKDFGFLNDLNQ